MKRIMRLFLLLVSAVMLVWSVLSGEALFLQYRTGRENYREAEQDYTVRTEEGETSEKKTKGTVTALEKEEERPKAPISVDFGRLREKNPDVKGWIYIGSVGISYPVLQGSDNDYYLTHTWDRQEIFAASIFMDYRNYPDFEDHNTILYGHNMKDGSMFHNIQYCMEEEYYKKDPYIWILTPEGDYQYLVFSEYDTRYDSDTYTLFDGPGKSLADYIRKMQGQSLWKTEVETGETEHILTLSTCNGETDLRRIVQAKRIQ